MHKILVFATIIAATGLMACTEDEALPAGPSPICLPGATLDPVTGQCAPAMPLAAANNAPTARIEARAEVDAGDFLRLEAVARDPDGDVLEYRWRAEDGEFTTTDQAETRWEAVTKYEYVEIRVTVTDPHGAEATAEHRVRVNHQAQPAKSASVQVTESWPVFTADVSGADYSADNWEYSVDGLIFGEARTGRGYQPAGRNGIRANITSSMRENGTTVEAEYCAGTVCDAAAYTLSRDATETSNRPPVVADVVIYPESVSSTADAAGRTVTLTAVASDPDGDSLDYRWEVDSGDVRNRISRQTTWVLPATAGTYGVVVTVTDDDGATARERASVTVTVS